MGCIPNAGSTIASSGSTPTVTLYWTPEDKKISIAATRGNFRFLGLGTLVKSYGAGGVYAVRSLGLGIAGARQRGRKDTQESRGELPENH